MSTDTLQLSALIPADPPTIFAAWLDSAGHTAMTGAAASAEARAGAQFTAWDGYIRGETIELDPGRRIVQTWRTSEFPEEAPDSQLEILLEAEGDATRITILHTELPEGQGERYRQGWHEFYFDPMRRFFAQPRRGETSPPPSTPDTEPVPAAAPERTTKKSAPKAAARTRSAAAPRPKPAPKAAATNTSAKKTAAKKTAAKKTAAKKTAATKTAAKKTAVKKTAVKKTAATKKKAAAPKAKPTAKKAAAKKRPAPKAPKKAKKAGKPKRR